MTTHDYIGMGVIYLLLGGMIFTILHGFGAMVLHHIRLIRAKLKSARATIRASRELRKRLQNKGDPK